MNDNMSETKSGFVWLTGSTDTNQKHRIKLMAVAYTAVSDPFIVFYRDSAWIWRKPCAFLRLKACTITESDELGFTLIPSGERIGRSTGMLSFGVESRDEKQEWLRILRDFEQKEEMSFTAKLSRKTRRNRLLPVIEESFTEEVSVMESRRPSLIPV